MSERLPLFVLDTVLFPGVVLPLHVFEPRYRQLMTHLLEQPEPRELGVLGVCRSGDPQDVGSQLQRVGCIAALRRFKRHDNGSSDVVVVGTERFRMLELADTEDLYFVGEVERPDAGSEPVADPDPETQLVGNVARMLTAGYLKEISALRERSELETETLDLDLDPEPDALSWLIASATVLTRTEAQSLLEIDSAVARLRAEIAILRREIGLIAQFRCLPVSAFELGALPGEN